MRTVRSVIALALALTVTLVACGSDKACASEWAQKSGSPPPAPKSPPPAPKAPAPAPKAPTPPKPAATTPKASTGGTTATQPKTTAAKTTTPPSTPKQAKMPKPTVSEKAARNYPGDVRPTREYVPPPPVGYHLGDPFNPLNPFNRWNPISPFYGWYYFGYSERQPCKMTTTQPSTTTGEPR